MESKVARTEPIVSHFRFKESDNLVSIRKKIQTPQTESLTEQISEKAQKRLYNRRRKEWQSFAKEECEL